MAYVIETQELRKTFTSYFRANVEALAGVTLQVEEGSAFGLLGPNGAGKTTFIKTLLGICEHTSGEVRVLGEAPGAVRAKMQIGYLPERLDLPPAWSPLAFLKSIARSKHLYDFENQAQALLEKVGLSQSVRDPMGRFSKGMKQRVGLAAVLVGKPKLLVLDEPTDGVDPVGRIEIRDILKAELNRGATLILNSHLLAETEKICSHVSIMHKGKIARSGSTESVTQTTGTWSIKTRLPLEAETIAKLELTAMSSTAFSFVAKDEARVNAVVDALRAQKSSIVELKEMRFDLEDLFREVVA